MPRSAAGTGWLEALLGEDPLVLVDVGARGGIPRRWRPVQQWIRTIGFEPDPRSLAALGGSDRVTILPAALAARKESISLHLTAEESDSSVLAPNRPFVDRFLHAERFDVIESRTVDADTLDNQLAVAGVDRVDFIKLDTQASELMVLEGASETLRRGVFGIEVEVGLNPMYEQQPLLADVDRFLRPLGYELFELEPRRWGYRAGEELLLGRGQVVWADAVYLLGPDRAVPFLADSAGAESLARIVAVCLLYNQGGYALALLGDLGEQISPQLRDRLSEAVRAYDSGTEIGRHALATRISARDLRRSRELSRRTGIKPAKQLRLALAAWLDAHEAPPG